MIILAVGTRETPYIALLGAKRTRKMDRYFVNANGSSMTMEFTRWSHTFQWRVSRIVTHTSCCNTTSSFQKFSAAKTNTSITLCTSQSLKLQTLKIKKMKLMKRKKRTLRSLSISTKTENKLIMLMKKYSTKLM